MKNQKKARDTQRMSDLSSLSRAIEEYYLDLNTLPDNDATTRTSNVLPSGNSGPESSTNSQGWIDHDLSEYITKLPVDPLNTGASVYNYRRNGGVYELNAVLEFYTDKMSGDGGNASGKYEVGTDLTILN